MDPFVALILIIILIVVLVIVVKKVKEHVVEEAEKAKKRAEEEAIEEKKRAEEEARRRKQEQIDNLSQKYMDNPYTIEAAEIFTKAFIKALDALDRDMREDTIILDDVGIDADISTDGKCYHIQTFGWWLESKDSFLFSGDDTVLIDFIKKNLQPLKTEIETCAFIEAISSTACEMIKKQYSRDKCGTAYKLTVSSPHVVSYPHGHIRVDFNYSAPNANYTPPAEW